MQSIFYLKPQGHQIWAYNYPKICRFLLTFSILQYLIGFIFYPTMKESILCLRTTFPYVLFDWYPCLVVIHLNSKMNMNFMYDTSTNYFCKFIFTVYIGYSNKAYVESCLWLIIDLAKFYKQVHL